MSLRSGEHGKSFVNLLIEVILIAKGVFLALWANNWHEDREHRAQAKAAVHNFLGEMEANLQATQRNRPYHETLARELDQFLKSKEPPTDDRFHKEVHFEGVRPVIFEHTARNCAEQFSVLSPREKCQSKNGLFEILSFPFWQAAIHLRLALS